MSKSWVIGIDPGKTGAICFVLSDGTDIIFIDNKEMLITSRAIKTQPTIEAFLATHTIEFVMYESVHSISNMSAKSNFSFGWNVGIMSWYFQILCEKCNVPYKEIQPKQWQALVETQKITKEERKQLTTNQKTKLQKQYAFDRAVKILGDEKPFLGSRGGVMDGRVDAFLIAYAGLLQ